MKIGDEDEDVEKERRGGKGGADLWVDDGGWRRMEDGGWRMEPFRKSETNESQSSFD